MDSGRRGIGTGANKEEILDFDLERRMQRIYYD